MKKSAVAALILTVIILISIASPCFASDVAKISESDIAQARELGKSVNAFAFDLYNEMAKNEKGNIFFSPLSISMALALAYEGAAGETREEMKRALHYEDAPGGGFKTYLDLVSNTPPSHGTFFFGDGGLA